MDKEIKNELGKVYKEFDNVHKEFDKVRSESKQEFGKVGNRLTKVEKVQVEMKKDINYLKESYEALNEKVDLIASEMVTKDDLIKMEERIEEKMATKAELNQFYNVVDACLKELKLSNEERTISNHRIDRLETWTTKASKKLAIKF